MYSAEWQKKMEQDDSKWARRGSRSCGRDPVRGRTVQQELEMLGRVVERPHAEFEIF